ncbi:toxin secretion ABC transporter ATP-binding protein [Fischerella sp. NIES-4106]|nr:toxin secretion ABC transporter ATP-binding protein [Fischerella sp. NIES-4106]
MMSLKAKILLFNRMDSQSVANLIDPLRSRMAQAILIKENLPARISILYEGQAPLLGYPRAGIAPQTLEKLTPGAIFGATSAITGVISTIQLRGSSCTNCHDLRPFTDAVVI